MAIARGAALLLAVLVGACDRGDDCFGSGGGWFGGESMTPPLLPIDGTWEGREAPFRGSAVWWRFELEEQYDQADGVLEGSYVTDYFFHWAGLRDVDTAQGTVTGFHCRDLEEVEIEFEITFPGNYGHEPPAELCRFVGRERGYDRLNGLLSCQEKPPGEVSPYPVRESAMYLDRVDGPF